MLPFRSILPIDRASGTALYLQIASGMIEAIQKGILESGATLPGTRTLAKTLQVHRKTVISAYDELYAQSWVDINPRKGVKVAGSLPESAPRAWGDGKELSINDPLLKPLNSHQEVYGNYRIVVNDGYPDIRLFPYELITREYRFSLRQKARQSMEDPLLPWGAASLRESLTSYLHKTRGIAAGLDHLMVTNGAQMAIYLSAVALLNEGDHVVVGTPGYHLAEESFNHLGAVVHRIPVDQQGIDTDVLERICRQYSVRMVYCIPNHHYPTTVTLSADRRQQLLTLSRHYGFTIIEDDYDYDFQYDESAYLPLYSVAEDCDIVYVGSFSKVISPYLRIGFLVARPSLIEKAYRLRRLINIMGDEIMENTLAALIDNGDLSRHINKATKIYRERRDYLIFRLQEAFGDRVSFEIPNGGMALWVEFSDGFSLERAIEAGRSRGIDISSLKLHLSETKKGVRIGFASLEQEEADDLIEVFRIALPFAALIKTG